jgi:hypothetical protein
MLRWPVTPAGEKSKLLWQSGVRSSFRAVTSKIGAVVLGYLDKQAEAKNTAICFVKACRNLEVNHMIRIKFSITVVEQSKVKDCDRSPAGIPGLNTAGGIDVCL